MSSVVFFYIEEVGVMIEELFLILVFLMICIGIVVVLEGLLNVYMDVLILVWGIVE